MQEVLDINPASLYHLEDGTFLPGIDKIRSVCEFFGVDADKAVEMTIADKVMRLERRLRASEV